MAAGRLNPHILIEGDTVFTEQLWLGCETKPFVLSPFWSKSRVRKHHRRNDDPIGFRFPIFEAIDVLLKHKPDVGDFREHLASVFAVARDRFGLAQDEPLVIATVGSHTTLYRHAISGMIDGASDHDVLDPHNFMRGMRKARALAGLLGAALDAIPRTMGIPVEPVWLADVFPQLRPTVPAPPEFTQVSAMARAELEEMQTRPHPEFEIPLRLGPCPLIYVKDGARDWHSFEGSGRRGPRSTTDGLIAQFASEKRRRPDLRGVLLKLLCEDLSQHNVVDAPIIGDRSLWAAAAAGLDAVLLDERVGVIHPPNDDRTSIPEAGNGAAEELNRPLDHAAPPLQVFASRVSPRGRA